MNIPLRMLVAACGFAAAAASAQQGARVLVVEPDSANPRLPSQSSNLSTISPFDLRLAERVAQALASDPSLQGADIRVAGRDGNVTLAGSTVDAAQAARAQQVADAIAGVGHASSLLTAQRP